MTKGELNSVVGSAGCKPVVSDLGGSIPPSPKLRRIIMGSSDLPSHRVKSIGGKRCVAGFTDNVSNIRRELSLSAEYQIGEDAALAVSFRLIRENDFDTLFELWDKYGKPEKFDLIQEEVGIDKLALRREVSENKKSLKAAKEYLQKGLDIVFEQERKMDLLERNLKVFKKDEKSYLAKR